MVSDTAELGGAFADPTLWLRLQRSWVLHLQEDHAYYNWIYLRDKLKPPIFQLGDSRTEVGSWARPSRTITISRHHIAGSPWEVVRDTLRHEMAHQYVDEVMGGAESRPHGVAFAEACRLLRCDPSARVGLTAPSALSGSRDPNDRILTRIKELLALATSSNEHEAATAMRLAQRELAKYNLTLAQLEKPQGYCVRHVGHGTVRAPAYQRMLANILQKHFFVRVIWVDTYHPIKDRMERLIELSGTPENLDVAEYVYRYVLSVAESLWLEYKRRQPKGGASKLQYKAGLLQGFGEKLDAEAARRTVEERALILRGDSRLEAFVNHLHPRLRSLRWGGVTVSESFQAGRDDGKNIILRRPITEHTNRGRALPPPSGS